MIPWIESVFPLRGAKVLEIGCGTGSATFAMAQRCERVESFDIDRKSLDQAEELAALLDIENVAFALQSDDWAMPSKIMEFPKSVGNDYDVVLLAAVVEHLLQEERIPVLRTLWQLLRPGGIMVIYDTPNRLYPYDSHTFRLPFAQWLPDNLMLEYLSHSTRKELTDQIKAAENPVESMGRFGRGVSYHEFELAIGLDNLSVINDGYSQLLTHRHRNTLFEGMIVDAISKHEPYVPVGFSKDYLELILKKKWQNVEISERSGVSDQLLDGSKRALLLESGDSVLRYAIPDGNAWCLRLDVLTHAWSGILEITGSDEVVLRREDLFLEFARLSTLSIQLPPGTTHIALRVDTSPRSKGRQAWILGAGVVSVTQGGLARARSE
jgi:S-adenosylmethionine-dependent methyltransferase